MATHDSGIVFSLALSTFAAWRGAALSLRRTAAADDHSLAPGGGAFGGGGASGDY